MRKDELDAGAARRAPEAEDFGNRKLIRPTLPRPADAGGLHAVVPAHERAPQSDRPGPAGRKPAPP